MNRKLALPIILSLAFAICVWLSGVAYAHAEVSPLPTITAPAGFCNNEVAWQLDLTIQAPIDPSCGEGTWTVIVSDSPSDPLGGFVEAVANLTSRGKIGSFWFQPKPNPTPVTAPAGFCNNEVAWQLDLTIQAPIDPSCGEGTWTVIVSDSPSDPLGGFVEAVANLTSRGKIGSFWFQPKPKLLYLPLILLFKDNSVAAPAGFCQNAAGWIIDLASQNPVDPACGLGQYFVIVETVVSDPLEGFSEAVANLASRGGAGTFWFQPQN